MCTKQKQISLVYLNKLMQGKKLSLPRRVSPTHVLSRLTEKQVKDRRAVCREQLRKLSLSRYQMMKLRHGILDEAPT